MNVYKCVWTSHYRETSDAGIEGVVARSKTQAEMLLAGYFSNNRGIKRHDVVNILGLGWSGVWAGDTLYLFKSIEIIGETDSDRIGVMLLSHVKKLINKVPETLAEYLDLNEQYTCVPLTPADVDDLNKILERANDRNNPDVCPYNDENLRPCCDPTTTVLGCHNCPTPGQ
jgi:hypothetical protein